MKNTRKKLAKYLLALILSVSVITGTMMIETKEASASGEITEDSSDGIYLYEYENFKGTRTRVNTYGGTVDLTGDSRYVLSVQIKGNYKLTLYNRTDDTTLTIESRSDGTIRSVASTLTETNSLYDLDHHEHLKTSTGRWFLQHRAIKSKRYIPKVSYQIEITNSYSKSEGVYLYSDADCIAGRSLYIALAPEETSKYIEFDYTVREAILSLGGGGLDADSFKSIMFKNDVESLEIVGDYKITLYRNPNDASDKLVIYSDGRHVWAEDVLPKGTANSVCAVEVERCQYGTDKEGIYFYAGDDFTGRISFLPIDDSDFVNGVLQFNSSDVGTLGSEVNSVKIIGPYRLILNNDEIEDITPSTLRIAADGYVEGTVNTNSFARYSNGQKVTVGSKIAREVSDLSESGIDEDVVSVTIEKITEPKEEGVYLYDYSDCVYNYYDVLYNIGSTRVKLPLGYSTKNDWGTRFMNTGEYSTSSKASSIEIVGNYVLYVSNSPDGYGKGTKETDPGMPMRWSDPSSTVAVDRSNPDFMLNLSNHRGGMDGLVASAWVRTLNV